MKNLSNHFLVSMPQISDPIFRETIIYICSHDNSGAMGLIINKPINELDLNQETSEILKQTKLYTMEPTPNVYFGGPVDLNMGIILHPLDYSTKKTIKIYGTQYFPIFPSGRRRGGGRGGGPGFHQTLR